MSQTEVFWNQQDQQINKDLPRLSVDFVYDENQVRACLDSRVGYTQGLTHVAALLLHKHNQNTEHANKDLDKLYDEFKVGGFWRDNLPLYCDGEQQFDQIWESDQSISTMERLAHVRKHLLRNDITLSQFLPQAWLTLFVQWLPVGLAVQASDHILEKGMSAVLAITFAILDEYSEHITSGDTASVFRTLKAHIAEQPDIKQTRLVELWKSLTLLRDIEIRLWYFQREQLDVKPFDRKLPGPQLI